MIYDFSTDRNKDLVDKLSIMLDDLTQLEAQEAINAINSIRKETLQNKQDDFSNWFDVTIFPILEDFSKMTGSVLCIEKPTPTQVIATISNRLGLDITDSCRWIRYLLSVANHIGINTDGKTAALTLIFDYNG